MSAYAHQMEREFSSQNLSSRGNSEVTSSPHMESGFYMTSFAATIFIAHQMEREFSSQNLSSRGNSEVTSSPHMESGFYMTSFAATIFIGSLVAVGILFVTLVIALTVMLQSCEGKNAGVVEFKRIKNNDKNFCRTFALHAELNSLEVDEYPPVCRDHAILYVRGGQYERDLNISTEIVIGYFSCVTPSDDGLDLILMDIDDFLSSRSPHGNLYFNRQEQDSLVNYVKEAEDLKRMYMQKLYVKLQARGWPLVLVSRKLEVERDAAVKLLASAGFKGWFSLVLRFDNEMGMGSGEFFSRRREVMQNDGFRIKGMISSEMDALTGTCLGKHVFKIPNPMQMHYRMAASPQPVSSIQWLRREQE